MCNGFDEAWLVRVEQAVGYGPRGGTLLCFMRSGGPLYRAGTA